MLSPLLVEPEAGSRGTPNPSDKSQGSPISLGLGECFSPSPNRPAAWITQTPVSSGMVPGQNVEVKTIQEFRLVVSPHFLMGLFLSEPPLSPTLGVHARAGMCGCVGGVCIQAHRCLCVCTCVLRPTWVCVCTHGHVCVGTCMYTSVCTRSQAHVSVLPRMSHHSRWPGADSYTPRHPGRVKAAAGCGPSPGRPGCRWV